MNKNFKNKEEKGFVILFAVLISSVVLLIALGIANIASNENILSSSAREAQNAFFAADTGAECALYWDIKQEYFPKPTPPVNPATSSPSCDGSSKLPLTGSGYFNNFTLNLNSGKQCAFVTIDKDYPSGTGGTRIESRGSNVPCGSSSPKAIERAVRLTY